MATTTSPLPEASLTGGTRRGPDQAFRLLASGASLVVVVLVLVVGFFLISKAAPSLASNGASFFGSR
jgi:phosphate transport system permease protein